MLIGYLNTRNGNQKLGKIVWTNREQIINIFGKKNWETAAALTNLVSNLKISENLRGRLETQKSVIVYKIVKWENGKNNQRPTCLQGRRFEHRNVFSK